MKQKHVDLIHEIRMTVVQVGIPAALFTAWGVESGFFDKCSERRKQRKAEKKTKKKA